MRKLESVILSLTKQEVRNFKIYANRIKTNNRQKKILTLFDAYKSEKFKTDEDLLKSEFPKLNKNAFYRLRNRLLDEIDQSLLMLYNDMDDKILVMRSIIMAKISNHKNDYKSAYSLLLEAEKKAYKSEFFDLLNVIYNEMIALSAYSPEIDPRIYIKKIGDVEREYATLKELNRLIAEIAYELRSKNYEGDYDTIQALRNINERLSTSEIVNNSFQAKLKVFTCIRDILYQEKKITQLKEHLVDTYNSFETNNLWTKNYHVDKIIMIIWTNNIALKAKDFALARSCVEKLWVELNKYNKLYFEKYKWFYYQSLFIDSYLTDKIDEGIQILEDCRLAYLQEEKELVFKDVPIQTIIIFQLNLTVAYFSKNEFDKALDQIKVFFYTDVYKKLNPQLKLFIFIVDIIVYFERGDEEYVLFRIREVKRSLRNILSKDTYNREKEFLYLLGKLITVTSPTKNKSLVDRMQKFISESPEFEPGAKEYIDYKVFLEAKLNNESYYKTIKQYVGG